ncbi:granule-bound starch synthase 1 [Quercus suber]|uniref:Granule-bound starch synthase 1 n=1 Tax=Quercus suber TaxID=58331 RepID=A0AAW0M2F2_QUESU
MATVAGSNFVSTSSRVNCGSVTSGSEAKAALMKFGLMNHTMTHNGLRSLNKVDELVHVRTMAKLTTRQTRSKTFKSGNAWTSRTIVCGSGMNLIFVGTEVGPWSKTGGLGDVLGGLPPAMALKVGDKTEKVRFFHCYKRGVDRVFVDHPAFLEKVWGKTKSKIYGPITGEDFQDNQLRFSLLCQAALEAPRVLALNSNEYFSGPYGEEVIFIANDWHTALIPCYLKTIYKPKGIYSTARVAFCIHNIAYQGRFAFTDFSLLNLPDELKGSFDFIDGYEKPVKGRKINWMKAGILESDKVLTVSPYYAQELVSGEDKGVELDNIIRKTGIQGIVNGMDVQEWNPLTDKYTNVKYDASTGTGKKPMEKQLEQLEKIYPDKARGVAKFNVPLAHMIIAGADFILVPSRFEPCGLIQLHAMRYGTVPIVASTGGLVDTVKEGFTGFQMGSFNVECEAVDPADVTAVATNVKRALTTYGTPAFTEIIQNCMAQDLSWKNKISPMATVAGSNFVSTSSRVNYGSVTSGSEAKAALMKFGLINHTMTHNGLRSLNKVDELVYVRTMAKLTTRQTRSKTFKSGNAWTSRTIVCGSGMNLIFVGTEVGPWSKTGGLGDVLGGLPPAMALKVGDKTEKVRFFHCYKRGVDRVFVDHPAFLEKAALEAPRVLALNSNEYFSGPYGEEVIFIANDWHTALIPCYLKTIYKPKGIYSTARVAFCIHNIAYQGRFAFTDFSLLNLPDELKSSFDFIDGYEKPVKGRKINWMKAGILESDRVLTVSPCYAQELVSGEDKGVELDNILRKTGIQGIVNGMDVQEWNPLTDKYTNVKYDASTVRIFSLTYLKFIVSFVIFKGTGKKPMEKQLEQLEKIYPDEARGVAKFNVPLAHMIIAGADFILVPSRFEPCGLIQLHAMRYGTVPIVASTGGLADTVKEGFTGFQMGSFNVECEAVDPADVTAVATNVKRALTTYGTPAFTEIIQNCMAQDLSWKGPAKKWEEVLLSLGVAGSEPGIEGEEIAPLAKENVATP